MASYTIHRTARASKGKWDHLWADWTHTQGPINPEHTDLSAATEHVPCSWTLFLVGMPSFLRRKHYQKEIFLFTPTQSQCLPHQRPRLHRQDTPGYPEAAGPGRCRWTWQIFNTGCATYPSGLQEHRKKRTEQRTFTVSSLQQRHQIYKHYT